MTATAGEATMGPVTTPQDPPAGLTPRCGRPDGDGQCLRPLGKERRLPDGAVPWRCSRHRIVRPEDVVWSDRPRADTGRPAIGGRYWQLYLGEDVDAAVDARAARDGIDPHDALRAILRDAIAPPTPRRRRR